METDWLSLHYLKLVSHEKVYVSEKFQVQIYGKNMA